MLTKQIKSSSVQEKDSLFNEFLDISNKDENWIKHALEIVYHFCKEEKYDKSMLFTEAAIVVLPTKSRQYPSFQSLLAKGKYIHAARSA